MPAPWNAKHIPPGSAPWNSFSACLLAKSDRIGRARLDLVNRGHVIPPGREVHRESGGSAPCNPTLPTKHLSLGIHAIPSGQNLCHQGISIPLGFSHSLGSHPTKLHQLRKRMELFWFELWAISYLLSTLCSMPYAIRRQGGVRF